MGNCSKKPEGKRIKNPSASGRSVAVEIRKTMPVTTIVTLLPEAEAVLAEYGLHCFHCSASAWETLGEGCRSHGFEERDIDDLVDDLNMLLKEKPKRPDVLFLTEAAASALKDVLVSEGKESFGMQVTFDERGSFCLEFQEHPAGDERVFTHPCEPSVRLFACPLTLMRIGGATIDFREGRFKLDLPEDIVSACLCEASGSRTLSKGNGSACDCGKHVPVEAH